MTNAPESIVAAKLRALYEYEDESFHQQVVRFCHFLESTHGNLHSYYLYHLLIGSTPPDDLSHYDLPGADSIDRFISDHYERLTLCGAA